jgi:hypothetical protein
VKIIVLFKNLIDQRLELVVCDGLNCIYHAGAQLRAMRGDVCEAFHNVTPAQASHILQAWEKEWGKR